MNEVKVFQNSEFGELSVLLIDGREHFPATACAKALGYANPHDAIKRHCKRDGVVKREGVSCTTNQHGVTTKQVVSINYITEGNLYRLIINSTLPAAQRFERWVFDEVLPAIRKQEAYVTMGQLQEVIRQATVAAVSETIRQLLPMLHKQPQGPQTLRLELVEPGMGGKTPCKLEAFPEHVRCLVDQMMDEMVAEEKLNFSRIARFCATQGYPISNPSVKWYYVRRYAE